VKTDVALQGADLVSGGVILNVRKGVEMLLLNNLYVQGENEVPGRGQCDVSILLKQGLDYLSKSPYEALGLVAGCKTPEIRKAFKKNALKYHPDKNPKTTPLFQLMNAACDRLTDPNTRKKEERTAAAKRPKPPPPAPSAPPTANPSNQNNNGKQSYDPRTNQWSDSEWGKFQNPNQKRPSEPMQKAQEAARRKQYYDEILREQYKKAESDRRAKEYAARQQQQQGTRRSLDHKAEDNNKHMGSNSARGESDHTHQPYHRPRPPSTEANAGAGEAATGGGGAYANGRYNHYKASADGRVHPQNVPSSGGGATAAADSQSTNNPHHHQHNNPHKSNHQQQQQQMPKANGKQSDGIASDGGGGNKHNSSSSSNLRSGVKPSASRVPKPYGLRCLFIGTNAAELEWVTSKYHRNTLLAELSWRVKETTLPDVNLLSWESATKLIGSGKCRKKNLIPGAVYEFRVRAVEELSGGLLGYRSDWSDTITITLMADKTTNSHGLGRQASYRQDSFNNKTSTHDHGGNKVNENKEDNHNAKSNTKKVAAEDHTASKGEKQKFERFASKAASKGEEEKKQQSNSENIKADANNYANPNKDLPKEKESSSSANSSAAPAAKPGNINTSASSESVSPHKVPTPSHHSSPVESPVHEMHKVKVDPNRRYPSNAMSASGREAWTKQEAQSKEQKGNGVKKSKAAAAGVGDEVNVSDLEVDEEIDENETMKDDASVDAKEVDDDEEGEIIIDDNSSLGGLSAVTAKSKQPVPSAGKNAATTATTAQTAATSIPSAPSGIDNKKKNSFGAVDVEEDDDDDDYDDDDDEEESDGEGDDFEIEEQKLFTLYAPASKVKAKRGSNHSFYSHPVRAEPVIKSSIVGYLILGNDVISTAEVGNWLKVRIHKPPNRKHASSSSGVDLKSATGGEVWGWSVRADKQHEYLKPSSSSTTTSTSTTSAQIPPKGSDTINSINTPSKPLLSRSGNLGNPLANRSMRALPKYPQGSGGGSDGKKSKSHAPNRSVPPKNIPIWMELYDPEGHAYYFNELTNESKWEPPDWVEETDPASGSKYYVNLGGAVDNPEAPLHSTWTQPEFFAKLLRHDHGAHHH